MKPLLRIGVVVCLIAPAKVSWAFDADAIRMNNSGTEQLGQENSYLAYKSLVGALERDPFNPTIHLNLGLAFLVNKEPAKAVKSFATAARLFEGNAEFQFYSLFNGGVAASQVGDIPGALKFYQAALELRPDSKEAKTNIELLWKGSGGQGQGQGQNQQQNQDQQQQKDPKDQNRDGDYEQKKQPQPFQSKELSPEDVRKILEELKNQEQKIRAQENEQGQKEAPRGKDW